MKEKIIMYNHVIANVMSPLESDQKSKDHFLSKIWSKTFWNNRQIG